MTTRILIIMRLVACCIFAIGAIYIAINGKDGWGWFIFASLCLGCVTTEIKENV